MKSAVGSVSMVLAPTGGGLLSLLTVNPQPNGAVTFSRDNGDVMSVQPGGAVEWRPAGTAGNYELADPQDTVAWFHPGGESWPFMCFMDHAA